MYFVALALIANFFLVTALTGKFYDRLWLWTFMLATIAGLSNYILIMIVAKHMYIYYKNF